MRPVILCLDDEEQALHLLVQQLHRELGDHYEIPFASSSVEALELLKILQTEGVELQLIIAAQTLVAPRGNTVLDEVHSTFPQALSILLTAPGQAAIAPRGNAKSASSLPPVELYRYLTKPWDETDLLMTVQAALRCYQQQQDLLQHEHAMLQAHDQSSSSHSLLEATLDATADGILALDRAGQITHFNQALLQLFSPQSDSGEAMPPAGHSAGSLLNNREQTLPHLKQWLQNAPELWEQLMAQTIAGAWHDETTVQNQSWQDSSLTISPPHHPRLRSITLSNGRSLEYQSQLQMVGDAIVGQVWSFHDVTERQRSEALIRYQAHHDFLTGIANRFKFNDVLDNMLVQAETESSQLAVLFIDLDRFKVINDSLGHSIGDELLKSFVQRLQRVCRHGELLARWGGDEFTMVISNLSPDGATQAARRILSTLHRPFEVQGHQLRINVSIGIAQYPQDGKSAEQLLKRADMALYQVKEDGRNGYQHYLPHLDQKGQALFAIESALHKALERNELSLHYQPQLDTETGEVTHVEALLRWQHPQLGTIAPEQFIAVAEQNGVIFPLGEWVLTEACRQAKAWQRMGLNNLVMCVNLSPLQLSQADLPTVIQQVLAATELEPRWLELEITESAALRNEHVIRDVLNSLQALGLGLALDDFGTGYSSLSYAKQLPFDTLKLDQSFVRDLMTNHSDGVIVQAVLAMGKGLQRRVVAEGVETEALRDLLKSWGCRYLQGYWFSCPLSAEAATEFLLIQQQPLVQAA